MAVTLDDVVPHLNLDWSDLESDDIDELQLFTDAANEWVETLIDDTTPSPVKLGTLELVRHWWDSQRGGASNPLSGDEIVAVNGVGFAIPNRVRELLDPYVGSAAPTYSFPDAVAFPDPAEWPC